MNSRLALFAPVLTELADPLPASLRIPVSRMRVLLLLVVVVIILLRKANTNSNPASDFHSVNLLSFIYD